jgi:hypothetical protein
MSGINELIKRKVSEAVEAEQKLIAEWLLVQAATHHAVTGGDPSIEAWSSYTNAALTIERGEYRTKETGE